MPVDPHGSGDHDTVILKEHPPFYSVRPLFPIYPIPEGLPALKRWILIHADDVVYRDGPAGGSVLIPDPLPADLAGDRQVYLGTRGEISLYAAGFPLNAPFPDCWHSSPVRDLSGKVSDDEMALAAYAARILDFDRVTAFCGRCGAKTRPLNTERARICPSCSTIVYPRISPAIIVLVKKGEEVLMARSSRSPPGFYSLIAGFNEPGENLEETVHREVCEEVGITVRNLRYFGSEPWPFPDSLMTGFVADYAGGDITVDNQEIESACWFTRDTLPLYPSKASISQALVEAWIRREI